jgi:hypothetical protein
MGRRQADIAEQVYRSHCSSMKLEHSWSKTVRATCALGRLFDVVSGTEVRAAFDRHAEVDTVRRVLLAIWPEEKLEDILAPLTGEDFKTLPH